MRTTFYNELNSLNGDGYPHLTHNIGVSFSSNDPNSYSGVWLNILVQGYTSYDFTIGGYGTLAGSYLPKMETDTSTSTVFYGLLFWTDIIVTNDKSPTFISHNSSLDIINSQSKFETTIQPSVTSFHDVVPTDIIQPLINELISNIYLQNKTITTSLQSNATQSIISGYSVTNLEPYGNFICDNGSDVTFQSEGNIFLKPGFWAKSGSNFLAKIESIPTCSSYNNNTYNKNLVVDNEIYESQNIDNDNALISYNLEYIQNIPNPFKDITKIMYKVKDKSSVTISIYDIYGKKMTDLLSNKIEDAGVHFIDFDFSSMPSGIYLCEFTNQSIHKINKMIKIN